MQANSPWYTPPSSALNNEANNSNYFYNYSQHWGRPPGSYDNRYYQNQPQHQHHMNGMRGCGDNYPTTNQNAQHGYESQPPGFFRQGTVDYDVNQHMRNRSRLNNMQHQDIQQPNFDKMRTSRPNMKTNDCEVENFSSVFTQSLTSLYSQDVDGNFVEEKNFGEERNGGLIPCTKIKTEEPSSDCQAEYGFNTVFDVEAQNPILPDFGNVKVKTEPFSRDSGSSYEGYSIDDMYVRRKKGTLAEAYSRKRKHSVPTTAYATGMNNEEKCPRLYQSDSQWIPNAVRNCDESVNDAYQPREFPERYQGFEGTKAKKRQPVKPRVTRRSEASEAKSSGTCKKTSKKVSPLTVYVKVLDDRILDVTCRRYKKRSKPKSEGAVAEEGSGNQAPNPSTQTLCPNESWRNVYDIVEGVVTNLVDKVAKNVEPKILNVPDLNSIHPMRAKELLYRFCCDYNLDFRDFTNLDDILRTDVTAYKDETPSRKRKGDRVQSRLEDQPRPRRGRSADNDEVVIAKVVEKSSDKPIEEEQTVVPEQKEQVKEPVKTKPVAKPKPKSKATRNSKQQQKPQEQEKEEEETEVDPPPQTRVLRSLPSRQPRPPSRKTRTRKKSTAAKNRYPKRNLRSRKGTSGKGGKKLKILIDLSTENDTTEVLEVDSDTNSNHSTDKCQVKSDVESDNEVGASKIEDKSVVNDKAMDTEPEDEDNNNNDIIERMKSMVAFAEKQILSIPLVKIKTEFDEEEEDFGLRQPPQLVRMTEDSNTCHDDQAEKESSNTKGGETGNLSISSSNETEEASSSGDNAPPPTLQPNESYSLDLATRTDSAISIASSATDSGETTNNDAEIPNDTDNEKLDEVVNQLAPDSSIENKTLDETKFDEETVLVEAKATDSANVETAGNESNSEDDCIMLVEHEPPKKTSEDVVLPKITDFSDISILKDNFLNKSMFGKDGEMCLDPKSLSLSTSLKGITKDEQEESILRSLLLETEAVSNSNIGKDLDPTDCSNPILTNLLGNASKYSFPGLNMETIHSPEFTNQLQNLANESFEDIAEALRLPKLSSAYHDAYMSGFSVESFEEAQKLFIDSIPPLSQLIPNNELKESLAKDTYQMKDKIKKLKDEIVYLQLMADQKEKEKVAIVCFKRYKEEILRRIYRAYAFSVQDHVRDWVFAKREASSDSCSASSSSMSSFLPPTPSPRSDTNNTSAEPPATSSRGKTSKETTFSSPSSITTGSPSIFTPTIIQSSKDQTVSSSIISTTTSTTSTVTSTVEKVSTVETMVAKATQNYGLDMSNLRDRLRCSPETPTSTPSSSSSSSSSSGTILQKVLSSQSSSRNSTPERPFKPQPWSPDNQGRSRNHATTKPIKPSIAKPYAEKFNVSQMDLMRNSPSKNVPSPNASSKKVGTLIKANPDASRSHVAECSQIQTLLAEPIEIKTHRNPYRSWSIQSGSRLNDNGPSYPTAVPGILPPSASISSSVNPPASEIESPLQKQLKSSLKPVSFQNYDLPSAPLKPGFVPASHRSLIPSSSDKPSGNNESFRKRSDEDRRKVNKFESSFSAVTPSSTPLPFGSNAMNTGIPLVPTVQVNKNRPPSRSSPPLCMGCGFTTAKFICSGCRKHWYCSSRCQCLIWPEHSRVCEGRPFPQSPNLFN